MATLTSFFNHESHNSLSQKLVFVPRDPLKEYDIFVKDFQFKPKETTLPTPLPGLCLLLEVLKKEWESVNCPPPFSLDPTITTNLHPLQRSTPQPQIQTTFLQNHQPLFYFSKVKPNESTLFHCNSSLPSTQITTRSSQKRKADITTLKDTREASPKSPKSPKLSNSSKPPKSPISPKVIQDDENRKRKRWLDEDMIKAMELVRHKKLSTRKAAAMCNVPRSTLWDRLSGRVTHGIDCRKKPKLMNNK
jgi:predicted DNA-binding protein (UPF0251 family)